MSKIKKYSALSIFFILLTTVSTDLFAQNHTTINNKTADGQHDFDFEIGTWETKLSRLVNPLSGEPPIWVEYQGTTVVRKVMNGKANLVELIADGPAGHFEGISLRLYNPISKQWTLNFASLRTGTLSLPTYGSFKNGVGEFFNQEILDNGQAIFVKFIISKISHDVYKFEQSFSNDGGKTWELNWVAIDSKISK
ncbi:MAG: hypothetical protein JST62_10175 [Bacteroidetes bacterium]|nr:hypothetical protein [Bacteroidota bacterium]MCB0708054.1 hypothetical protein [Chitinophagaceae bacterium]